MTIEEIKNKTKEKEYDFLRREPLKDNIILLGLGGSYAYGMNNENSDIDIRGIATNTAKNIILRKDFENVVDTKTDTTVYSLEKMLKLLSECNPNTIEILGLRKQDYLYLSEAGRLILENRKIFLSKRAIFTFGGYANAQLRRLENKAARDVGQAQREKYILRSIKNAQYDFKRRYFDYPDDAIHLYIDESDKEEMETEIFMDINLKHYPLRDYKSMWNDMNSIVKDYNKVGRRNQYAIEKNRLSKHMSHCIRLYFMLYDIVTDMEIITYRKKEHDLLMDIRNGKYLDENGKPIKEFYNLLNSLDEKFNYYKTHNNLPDEPDIKAIENLLYTINTDILKNNI